MLRVITAFTLLVLLLLPGNSAFATGDEFTLSGSDLIIGVNSKWAGCSEGGYYPIRLSIRNNGKTRRITVEVNANNSYQKSPIVTRSFTLEQNTTVNSSLLVPVVSDGSYVDFRILSGARPIKNMSRSISLPEVSDQNNLGPGMLIVANKPVDKNFYNDAIDQFYVAISSYRYGTSEFAEHVRPENLPTNWLAYSGLDILAIPLETLTRDVSAEAREAIFQWVSSGGNLLIYEVKDGITKSTSLENVLDWKNRAHVAEKWTSLDFKKFQRKNLVDIDGSGVAPVAENFSLGKPWRLTEDRLSSRDFGLGTVVAISDNPFPGTVSHWIWFLNHLSQDRMLWKNRNGISPRSGNQSFLHFLIPGIGGVPVITLLILITIFTTLIGPVNYIYFARKRQLAMLLVTVPAIAFGSSLILLGYSTITHGFSVKSRVRSITFLDQKQKHAMSISRVAYYAGMAPSGGLHFEPTTAVYPIWSIAKSFESGRVDWSDTQNFRNGWLRSRTRTQFLTVSQQEQRGRIDLQSSNSSAPKVSNGLEWNIDTLIIADEAGKVWVAKTLNAGEAVSLKPISSEHRNELRTYLSEYSLGMPAGMLESELYNEFSSYDPSPYGYGGNQVASTSYPKSLQEKSIQQMSVAGNSSQKMKPGSYIAILKQAPDLDLGLKNTSKKHSIHLLFGYF